MKIYLYLPDRLISYNLPKDISGSFSFDPNPEEESKLINIEERENKWILYSTNDSKIIINNNQVSSIDLEPHMFYHLLRNNTTYLIGTEELKDIVVSPFKYNNDFSFTIGNTNNCNVRYSLNLQEQIEVKLYQKDNTIILEKVNGLVYVNKISIDKVTYINIGDNIDIFGIKIMFLPGIVLFSYIDGKLSIVDKKMLSDYIFPNDVEPINEEINDVDLYGKDDYYSKSPRLRRIIETKKIKLSDSPSDNETDQLPAILVVGPMVTMGATSIISLISTLTSIKSGDKSINDQWPTVLTCIVMLISMLIWPLITQLYNKHMAKKHKEELIKKYNNYLNEKRIELQKEEKLQRDIIIENLLTTEQCLNIINQRKVNFWDKRVDQSDFLVARIGVGNELLNAEIEFPDKGFTIDESELRKNAEKLVEDFKYIKDVPVSYSFYDNKITAIMGTKNKTINFINSILIQFLAYYTYEDLKIVVITNEQEKENWTYLRYLNHTFTNDKSLRFFASDAESSKEILDYLNFEINRRKNQEEEHYKPHYLIIVDDYSKVKRHEFIQNLTEEEKNLGFSMILKENLLKNLPSKCDNFIVLNDNQSGILKNSYEKQEQTNFKAEITYNMNTMGIAKILSNIPIEFEDGLANLPDTITFLEMEHVGKIEQLNILNRWNTNDSTTSLKAEIGVNEQEDLMYLDLHEKHHGPHGLIAGTTGSGKSEFIITYILSMCINYSPDDISFILIDYKGGGLALAFENKASGVILPHLAGTITNLDKAEMDRTLVSIKSEAERRQKLFNEARDALGESTMDIYKYQKFFHEGKITEPISHLFIICDEFAELKDQQPEFMDDLISIARIGRSLGVHLILATQKPSGVVNDQIWSNSKFKVCLKVQDEADSKEMLKKPDAAHIRQAGRFYLQVGYDEYYALGQSGWCGAKYFPADQIVKQVDKSINFINDCGEHIKNIQAASGQKKQASGDQLSNILNSIIVVAKMTNKKSRKLWLDNVPEIILENDLEKKYNITHTPYNIEAIIGEYDAPEKQEQGLVKYNLINDGNSICYGIDGSEREMFLSQLICSTCRNHKVEEINHYIIDYGSESLRKFEKLPHIGGIVYVGEEEKYKNLFKLIKEEISKRKRILSNYGGEYLNYIKQSEKKLPIISIIINNYDSLSENDENIYYELPDLVRDSERYGIVYTITASATNSVPTKIANNFKNIYTYRLKDSSDYTFMFNIKNKIVPREINGRGLFKLDAVHEFQTASITTEEDENKYVDEFIKVISSNNNTRAIPIPTLPRIIRLENVKEKIKDINNIPIGITKDDLEIQTINLIDNLGYIISSNKLDNTYNTIISLLSEITLIPNSNLIVFDPSKKIPIKINNYYNTNFDKIITSINELLEKYINEKSTNQGIILFYGVDKLIQQLEDKQVIEDLSNNIKKYEQYKLIIVDDANKIKTYAYENWFTSLFNTSEGLWIGKGIADQGLLKTNSFSKELNKEIKNNMGYIVSEGSPLSLKLIDFYTKDEDDEYEE